MMDEKERKLIGRACDGDVTAFQKLVERYKKKIYYLSYDITGNHHDAEDVSQEVFIKAFRSIRNFRREAKMSSWLYQITVNASIDSLRRESSKPKLSMTDDREAYILERFPGSGQSNTDPQKSMESSMIQQHIYQALQKISPRERSVFVMRHYNDLKTKEIADILSISQGAAKSFLFRAIKKLRKELSFYLNKPGMEATHE